MQQGSAQVFRPRPGRLHSRAALLPLHGHGLRGAPKADHRAQLLLRERGETQLPHTDEDLQRGLRMQVKEGALWGLFHKSDSPSSFEQILMSFFTFTFFYGHVAAI